MWKLTKYGDHQNVSLEKSTECADVSLCVALIIHSVSQSNVLHISYVVRGANKRRNSRDKGTASKLPGRIATGAPPVSAELRQIARERLLKALKSKLPAEGNSDCLEGRARVSNDSLQIHALKNRPSFVSTPWPLRPGEKSVIMRFVLAG